MVQQSSLKNLHCALETLHSLLQAATSVWGTFTDFIGCALEMLLELGQPFWVSDDQPTFGLIIYPAFEAFRQQLSCAITVA